VSDGKSEKEWLYLNVYEKVGHYRTISHYHRTREEADEAAKGRDDRISCQRIVFTRGQLDTDDCFYLNINDFRDSYTISQSLFLNRRAADSAVTRSSERVACVRIAVEPGRFDD
jgi:hypothetical protein